MELRVKLPPCSMQSTVHGTAREQLTNASGLRSNAIHRLSMLLPMQMGTWCSGITSASHAEGPGFKSQCVHFIASPGQKYLQLTYCAGMLSEMRQLLQLSTAEIQTT